MKNSSTGQSTKDVKKPNKHDANLQKNSILYFQIGLILCLLATYSLFEMQFVEKKLVIIPDVPTDEIAMIDVPPVFTPEVIKPKEKTPVRDNHLTDVYTPVDDDTKEIETKVIAPDEPTVTDKDILDSDSFKNVEEPEEDIVVPFVLIEKVPVYPGCERFKTNEKRKKCMSTKLNKLINRKFNTGLALDYGLSGKQVIHATFTIDKTGHVTKIIARAPHAALEKEAQRVINKIPEMQPGIQQNKPVGVIYSIPIVFNVRD